MAPREWGLGVRVIDRDFVPASAEHLRRIQEVVRGALENGSVGRRGCVLDEARIECVCTEIRIPDLGLHLVRGQVEWLPADKARASDDLKHARRVGAVSVTWRTRCEVTRPMPVWIGKKRARELRQGNASPVATPPAVAPVPPPAPAPDADVVRRISSEVQQIVRDEIRAALASMPAPQVVVTGASTTVSGPVGPVGADPLFIPTTIVPTETARIEVPTSESDGGGAVDAAAEALKSARRRGGRKKE